MIPGPPIPKARHRDGVFKGKRIKFDPQKEEKDRVSSYLAWTIKSALNSQNRERVIKASDLASAEVLHVDFIFHLPIPETDTETQRKAKLWGLIPHNIKPDTSNLVKFYEDAANGILYRDDCMIVSLTAEKRYSDNPRTEINIMPIKTNAPEEIQILSCISPYELEMLVHELDTISQMTKIADWEYLYENAEKVKQTASILSKIADKYAAIFTKISKRCPGYWQKSKAEGSEFT